MKRPIAISAFLLSSFLGGAVAQTMGGGIISIAQAALAWTTNLVYGGASSDANSAIWILNNLSGTASSGNADGQTSPVNIYFPSDTVDTTTSGFNYLSAMSVYDVASTGHTGGRIGVQGYVWVQGTPAVDPPPEDYVGVLGMIHCSANLRGTTGAYTNYQGGCFGGNSDAWTSAGATFLNRIDGHEFDVTLATGSSAADKYGLSVVQGSNDAVRGAYDDAAINVSSQAASTTWLTGIEFGSYAHQWAFGTDSTLIGAKQRQAPSTDTPVANYGVDFSAVTFTTAGAPIRMPLLTPASSSEACSTGSMKWDASYIYICTTTNTWKRAALSTF